MKQLLGLLVVTVLVTSLATAQFGPEKGKMTLGPALELALPLGDFSDLASFGVGGTARFEYGLQPKIALTGNIGYIWFSGESTELYDYSISAIPLIAGVKYSFAPQFFVSGELGFWFTTISGDYTGEPIPGIRATRMTLLSMIATRISCWRRASAIRTDRSKRLCASGSSTPTCRTCP